MNNEQNSLNDLMLQDALSDLQAGCVNAADKQILSYSPLPDAVIDPYLSQQVESNAVMDLTYNSLVTWIGEAKKASYFTKHFVTLSKMINNGVATMARGLVTLHLNGEDLSRAPMSIDDLISVGSYQFRKSYLGVIQTSSRNPEIGERLLLNQLSWTTTLLRLYKTKDKLAEKPAIKNHKPESASIERHDDINGKQAEISDQMTVDEPLLSMGNARAISEPQALSEPGAFSAVRSYSGFSAKEDRKSGTGKNQLQKNTANRPEISFTSELPKEWNEHEISMFNETKKLPDGNKEPADDLSGNGSSLSAEAKDDTVLGMNKITKEINIDQKNGSETKNEKPETDPENKEKTASAPNPDEENRKTCTLNLYESINDPSDDRLHDPPQEIPILDAEHPPRYFRILYDALCRNGGSEDGTLVFTNEEIEQLLADPAFCYYEKDTADAMRKLFDSEKNTE